MLLAPPAPTPAKEQFLAALIQIEKFSPAPVILAKALKLLRDPLSDIASIAELVGSDSALAADIIRCANSVYYGGDSSTSVAEAVQRVGSKETVRLLNLSVARIAGGRDLGCYGILGTDFWAECLYNGIFLQALATETGEADPDEAYTVGLLRYIGRLAINQTIENQRAGLYWDGGESISAWEQENVGFLQAEAGMILLEKWRFPPEIVQAIAGQDAPALLAAKNWLAEALFFAASLLPQGLGSPFRAALLVAGATPRVGIDFMHRYGLTPEVTERLLQEASAEFDRVRHEFGV